MMGGIANALTGYQNAALRLQVSANNIANESVTAQSNGGQLTNVPYKPQTVIAVSQPEGGVSSQVQAREPATIKRFEPESPVADENGFVDAPNVDMADEVLNQIIASYDAKANLKSIKLQDDLLKSTLDIFT